MSDMENILKAALSPTKYPSEELNKRIKEQVKESGEMKFKNKSIMIAAAVIICLLIIPTSVYAAYRYLLPKEVARDMQDKKLGDAFEKDGKEVLQTVTDGSYKVTYLGHVTGESISESTGSAWELHPDRFYVAVAIEKVDGTEMAVEDSYSCLFVSPLIQGLKPWNYNIATMNGSYMENVIDGVLYRIIECDNIEIFADKKLYMAVSDTSYYSTDAFNFDEETGLITANEAYKGANILFDLELDPSKADNSKAEEYLKQLENEWNQSSEEDSRKIKRNNETTEENPRIQQEIFTDDNKVTIHVKDNASSNWWANTECSQSVLSYSFDVEGEDIESLTYSLNKGEFCSYPTNNLDELEYYGKKCSISYDDQKDRNYLYSVIFSAKFEDYGYGIDDISNLGVKDINARQKIYYEVLDKEIESTNMDVKIKMKDGRIIDKTLTFDNVLEEEEGSFWVAISVN